MSRASVMPSNHLILCHPLFLLPSIFPSIGVFSNELVLRIRQPNYWSFSFSISPSNEHPWLISFRMDWLNLLAVQETLKSLLQQHSSKASILCHSAFFIVQLSHPYMTTGETIALTTRTFVGKVMSLLFNMLSRLVIAFLPRSKHLLISWQQSPSAVILKPRKIKSLTVSIVSHCCPHAIPHTWSFSMDKYFPSFIYTLGSTARQENGQCISQSSYSTEEVMEVVLAAEGQCSRWEADESCELRSLEPSQDPPSRWLSKNSRRCVCSSPIVTLVGSNLVVPLKQWKFNLSPSDLSAATLSLEAWGSGGWGQCRWKVCFNQPVETCLSLDKLLPDFKMWIVISPSFCGDCVLMTVIY